MHSPSLLFPTYVKATDTFSARQFNLYGGTQALFINYPYSKLQTCSDTIQNRNKFKSRHFFFRLAFHSTMLADFIPSSTSSIRDIYCWQLFKNIRKFVVERDKVAEWKFHQEHIILGDKSCRLLKYKREHLNRRRAKKNVWQIIPLTFEWH